MPMSLSAAESNCGMANQRKMTLIEAIAEPARRGTLNIEPFDSLRAGC
jgi:hypothetical protein